MEIRQLRRSLLPTTLNSRSKMLGSNSAPWSRGNKCQCSNNKSQNNNSNNKHARNKLIIKISSDIYKRDRRILLANRLFNNLRLTSNKQFSTNTNRPPLSLEPLGPLCLQPARLSSVKTRTTRD